MFNILDHFITSGYFYCPSIYTMYNYYLTYYQIIIKAYSSSEGLKNAFALTFKMLTVIDITWT